VDVVIIDDLEPGTYRLSATKSGFVRFDYGARTTGGTGAQFNLASGQSMKDISFRLVNTGVVSGRVRTSSGEPGAALNIQLMKSAYNVQGQRTFQSVSSGRTDDRGDYRLFWVTPGRYYVAIGGNSLTTLTSSDGGTILFLSSGGDAASTNVATVYFPGTTDPLSATTIDVGPAGVPGDLSFPTSRSFVFAGDLRTLPPDFLPAAQAFRSYRAIPLSPD
jgi:hypothetical protein